MKRVHIIAFGIICAAMLFMSSYSNRHVFSQWSDGYYRLLRIIVCLVSGFFVYIAYSTQKQWILWPCVAMIIIYNPILVIEFSWGNRGLIDFLFGLFFLIPTFALTVPHAKE